MGHEDVDLISIDRSTRQIQACFLQGSQGHTLNASLAFLGGAWLLYAATTICSNTYNPVGILSHLLPGMAQ
eukprot:337271-Amphidinium_carterae.1